jgi:hypothetical protein
MRATLIRSALALAAVAIAWLLGGRQLSLMLDRLITPRLYSLPVSPLSYRLDTLVIGTLPLDFYADARTLDLQISCDSANRVILRSAGKLFAMGLCTNSNPKGTGAFDLAPDPGDDLSLVVDRSLMNWPTMFEMNFTTGSSPSWKRDLYYRLEWKKSSGAKLAMLWRFEQYFYPGSGWASGMMTREGSSGLIEVDIVGESLSPQ